MKLAAYHAPLLPTGSFAAIDLIKKQVDECERQDISFLCCPEAILGGLADNHPTPKDIAIDVESGGLDRILAPFSSDSVVTIIGFTEMAKTGELYNSAAVFYRGVVRGIYRKRHPAINHSVYAAGNESPVFTLNGLTFGIMICNDSNFPEHAVEMAGLGARVIFIPSNNALPPDKADVLPASRAADRRIAKYNGVWVVRADVAGEVEGRVSHGSSGVTDQEGTVAISSGRFREELVSFHINTEAPR
jgi:5-aminopentanamidase